jgi:hypothetical protein
LSSQQSNRSASQLRSLSNDPPASLRVYLLTVWQDTGQEAQSWRFRLEDPHTRWRRGFANVHELIAILEDGLPRHYTAPGAAVDKETEGESSDQST